MKNKHCDIFENMIAVRQRCKLRNDTDLSFVNEHASAFVKKKIIFQFLPMLTSIKLQQNSTLPFTISMLSKIQNSTLPKLFNSSFKITIDLSIQHFEACPITKFTSILIYFAAYFSFG
jgi:hypothetical protein